MEPETIEQRVAAEIELDAIATMTRWDSLSPRFYAANVDEWHARRSDGDPPCDVNRYGYDAYGRRVYVHGPEIHRIGGRKRRVWCVRVSDRNARCNVDRAESHRVWDGGCSMCATRDDALALFRKYTSDAAHPSWRPPRFER